MVLRKTFSAFEKIFLGFEKTFFSKRFRVLRTNPFQLSGENVSVHSESLLHGSGKHNAPRLPDCDRLAWGFWALDILIEVIFEEGPSGLSGQV